MAQRPEDPRRIGPPCHDSPVRGALFIDDDERVLCDATTRALEVQLAAGAPVPSFEIAGPRRRIAFRPEAATAALVTCGGLCPGLNDVIRGIVLALWHGYGLRRILGYRHGLAGMSSRRSTPGLPLDPATVDQIRGTGGSMLGSSRGPQDVDDLVDTLQADRVDLLFAIGGDGTLRAAQEIDQRIEARGLGIAVVGLPKTIDNDIDWVHRSFGFSTAVEAAGAAIAGAHAEARSTRHGVGLVKLMGRRAGFIAMHATLAHSDVNFCLVPEHPYPIDGEHGLLRALRARLERRDHAVIVVAEGFGQELMPPTGLCDASGNPRLADIGVFLRDRIRSSFAADGLSVDVKYIDPSYLIRSRPPNPSDSELCLALAQHAVHAAMSGRSGLMIGHRNERFTHVPLSMVRRRGIRRDSPSWQRVLESTGQATQLSAEYSPVTPLPERSP